MRPETSRNFCERKLFPENIPNTNPGRVKERKVR